MERARGPRAEADAPGEEEEEVGAAMAAVVAAAGGAGPAFLQVAGLYRGLCAVRTRAPGLGLVSAAQLRVFPVRRSSGRPAGGADGSGVGDELEANPFYDRYRDKIQQLRRSDPAAFESRLEKRSEFRKQPVGHSKQGDFIKCVEQKTLGKQPVSRGFTKDKTLSSIFNIEMVKDKTAEEIKQIWQQYFAAKDTVYAVIPKEKFDLIWNRAQSCPTFLCALPRREGYEFFVGQWTGTELHFTALINIQTRGEAAASQLILYHYPELKEEKGIVLMTAEMDSTFLNVAEAQCMANQVQLFYATDRKETYGLVETFNFRPNTHRSCENDTEFTWRKDAVEEGRKCHGDWSRWRRLSYRRRALNWYRTPGRQPWRLNVKLHCGRGSDRLRQNFLYQLHGGLYGRLSLGYW